MLNDVSRISRRAAVTSLMMGGAGALTLLTGGAAQAQTGGGRRLLPSYAGYFTVPQDGIIAILIGLLLPAVQRTRQPFRMHLADSSGVIHSMPIESPVNADGRAAAFFEVRMLGDGSVREADGRVRLGDGSVRVWERGTKNTLIIPSLDGILIGLLLPAVRKDGDPVGMLAGSVMMPDGNGGANILPYIEQKPLYRTDGSAGAYSVGPFLLPAAGATNIGLLLPAVQRLRRPHELLLLDSTGMVVARDMIIGPERPSQQGVFSAFYDIQSDSQRTDRTVIRRGDGSVLPALRPPQPDGILIALLLPAVQKNGESVGMLGGSVQMPGRTLNFQEMSGPNTE